MLKKWINQTWKCPWKEIEKIINEGSGQKIQNLLNVGPTFILDYSVIS